MSWCHLDLEMKKYRNELTKNVNIDLLDADYLATKISSEIRFLERDQKEKIRQATPVSLHHRLDELKAFEGFMDLTRKLGLDTKPEVVRAKVVIQNYICFVYLSEACFRILYKNMPDGSVTKKCAEFLTDNPIRSFRSAVVQSNWKYSSDFSGLDYWVQQGTGDDKSQEKHTVGETELGFWQAFSRCVAYTSFSNL